MYSTSTRAGGGSAEDCFGFYVEKEYIGKRVKGSKVKVTWKFACLPDLKTNEVELKHSLVFGKREIKLNGQLVYHKKKMFNGDFHHRFSTGSHLLQVAIRDDFEGYVYDLSVDGVAFHRLKRINTETLEEMRKSKREAAVNDAPVKQMSYDEFVKGDKNTGKEKNKKREESDSSSCSSSDTEEENLWKDSNKKATTKSTSVPATASAAWTSDPFASAPSSSDPFGGGTPASVSNGSNGGTFDPFQQQQQQSVTKLAAGLEALDFNTPSYNGSTAATTYHTGTATNPFNSEPQAAYAGYQPQQQPAASYQQPSYQTNNLVNLEHLSGSTQSTTYSTTPAPASTATPAGTVNYQQQPKKLTQFNSDSITSLYTTPHMPPSQQPPLQPVPQQTTYAANNGSYGQAQQQVGGLQHFSSQGAQPQSYQAPSPQYRPQQPVYQQQQQQYPPQQQQQQQQHYSMPYQQ